MDKKISAAYKQFVRQPSAGNYQRLNKWMDAYQADYYEEEDAKRKSPRSQREEDAD